MTSDETAGPGTGKIEPLLPDFTKPVAVTMLTILHVIPDADDPGAIVAKVMGAVPSGSYLAVSHSASESSSRPARGQSHQSHQSAETA